MENNDKNYQDYFSSSNNNDSNINDDTSDDEDVEDSILTLEAIEDARQKAVEREARLQAQQQQQQQQYYNSGKNNNDHDNQSSDIDSEMQQHAIQHNASNIKGNRGSRVKSNKIETSPHATIPGAVAVTSGAKSVNYAPQKYVGKNIKRAKRNNSDQHRSFNNNDNNDNDNNSNLVLDDKNDHQPTRSTRHYTKFSNSGNNNGRAVFPGAVSVLTNSMNDNNDYTSSKRAKRRHQQDINNTNASPPTSNQQTRHSSGRGDPTKPTKNHRRGAAPGVPGAMPISPRNCENHDDDDDDDNDNDIVRGHGPTVTPFATSQTNNASHIIYNEENNVNYNSETNTFQNDNNGYNNEHTIAHDISPPNNNLRMEQHSYDRNEEFVATSCDTPSNNKQEQGRESFKKYYFLFSVLVLLVFGILIAILITSINAKNNKKNNNNNNDANSSNQNMCTLCPIGQRAVSSSAGSPIQECESEQSWLLAGGQDVPTDICNLLREQYLSSSSCECVDEEGINNKNNETDNNDNYLESDCITNLTTIMSREATIENEDIGRTYILCPNTIFTMATFDGTRDAILGNALDNGQTPIITKSNARVQCGASGSSSNNCTLSGGSFGVLYNNGWTFQDSISPNDVLIQGIRFNNFDNAGIGVFTTMNLTVQDCIFENGQDHPIYQSPYFLDAPTGFRRLYENNNDSSKQKINSLRRAQSNNGQQATHGALTFIDCIFKENQPKQDPVFVVKSGTRDPSSNFGLVLIGCIFDLRESAVEHVLDMTLYGFIRAENNCILNNQIATKLLFFRNVDDYTFTNNYVLSTGSQQTLPCAGYKESDETCVATFDAEMCSAPKWSAYNVM